MLLLIAAFLAVTVIAFVIGAIVGGACVLAERPDNLPHQSPDQQRLPTPCTCGVRRFCPGGCGADVVHSTGGKL